MGPPNDHDAGPLDGSLADVCDEGFELDDEGVACVACDRPDCSEPSPCDEGAWLATQCAASNRMCVTSVGGAGSCGACLAGTILDDTGACAAPPSCEAGAELAERCAALNRACDQGSTAQCGACVDGFLPASVGDGCVDLTPCPGDTPRVILHRDADGDSFGDASVAALNCDGEPGWVRSSTDCDDTSASAATIHPGADDPFGDFVDANCDGIDGRAGHVLFISPAGSDVESGYNPAKPLRSLHVALGKLTECGPGCLVLAAEGEYRRNVSTTLPAGLDLKGGYGPSFTSREPGARSVFGPSEGFSGRHLFHQQNYSVVRLEAVELFAPTGSNAQTTILVQRGELVCRDCVVHGPNGATGEAGWWGSSIIDPTCSGDQSWAACHPPAPPNHGSVGGARSDLFFGDGILSDGRWIGVRGASGRRGTSSVTSACGGLGGMGGDQGQASFGILATDGARLRLPGTHIFLGIGGRGGAGGPGEAGEAGGLSQGTGSGAGGAGGAGGPSVGVLLAHGARILANPAQYTSRGAAPGGGGGAGGSGAPAGASGRTGLVANCWVMDDDGTGGACPTASCTPTSSYERCNAVDDTCSTTDEAICPTGASVLTASWSGTGWVGNSNAFDFSDNCPAGSMLVGFWVGTSGPPHAERIQNLQAVCALPILRATSSGNGTADFVYMIERGDERVDQTLQCGHGVVPYSSYRRSLICPNNSVVVGVRGHENYLLNTLSVDCAQLSLARVGNLADADGGWRVRRTESSSTYLPDVGFAGGAYEYGRCPADQVMVGFASSATPLADYQWSYTGVQGRCAPFHVWVR